MPLWRGILEMQTMGSWQPGSLKHSPTPPTKIYIVHHTWHSAFTEEMATAGFLNEIGLVRTLFLKLLNLSGSITFYSCILLLRLRQVRAAGKKNLHVITHSSSTDLEPGVYGLSHLPQCCWLLARGSADPLETHCKQFHPQELFHKWPPSDASKEILLQLCLHHSGHLSTSA